MNRRITRLFLGMCLLALILIGCSTNQIEINQPQILEPSIEIPLSKRTYVNAKFSFVFQYPAIFTQKHEDYHRNGIYLWDENISLAIWGTSPQSNSFEKLQYNIANLIEDKYAYVTGTKQGKKCEIHYIFIYPKDEAELYLKAIALLQHEILK